MEGQKFVTTMSRLPASGLDKTVRVVDYTPQCKKLQK